MSNFFTLVSFHERDEERDNFYFNTQLPDKHLSIGWGKVNPIGKGYDEIILEINEKMPWKTGNNPDNGGRSLPLFSSLRLGDIVFVRGTAKIIDVAVITGNPIFKQKGHWTSNDDGDEYRSQVGFIPLCEGKQLSINTNQIITDEELYGRVLDEGGICLVMRKISDEDGIQLLKMILENN